MNRSMNRSMKSAKKIATNNKRPFSAKIARSKIAHLALAATTSVVCLLPLSASAKTSPNDITGLNIFGDSLSDAGNLFNLTGFPPSPPYTQRFSNGPLWVEQLASKLGLAPALSTAVLPELISGTIPPPTQGINFAIGGSLSSDINVGGPPLPGLQQQIETFGGFSTFIPPDPDALYILLAGGNDYNEALFRPSSLTVPLSELPNQVTDNLTNAATALIQSGAKHLLVGNLPNLSGQPFSTFLDTFNPQSSEVLSNLSIQHNQLLQQKLTQLQTTSGAHITQLNLADFFASATQNPDAFGFTNVTESCLTNFQPGFVFEGICDNPDEFLFWDNVHPTEAGHGAIAQFAFATLSEKAPPTNPPQSIPEPIGVLGLLIGTGIGVITLKDRRSAA
ncbi:MAG: carboxyl exterase [Phormidesmis priestleyi Ana]|uniref:Carboxyl exterase n=1 Tax=Phormidesmis priestleyi Ana TaxID=1666911 RepID=A0A0P7ZWJ4_9CYAN|nr:MAG: carboxyl exterase [Phormidesmis priestleyi Ana]